MGNTLCCGTSGPAGLPVIEQPAATRVGSAAPAPLPGRPGRLPQAAGQADKPRPRSQSPGDVELRHGVTPSGTVDPQGTGAATTHWRSRISEDECCRVGLARWPDLQFEAIGDKAQQAYAQRFATAADAAAQDIAARRLPDLDSVWQRATQWRVQQLPPGSSQPARQLRQRRVRGRLHTPTAYTPIVDRYLYMIERIQAAPRTVRSAGFAGRADVDLLQLATRMHLNGREVALTSLLVPCRAGSEPFEVVRQGPWIQPVIVHPYPDLLDELLAQAQQQVSELHPSLALPAKLERLGTLHWWLAQAMPDQRGSAAKAEFCVRAFAGAAGVALPPFRAGVVPDIEAFLEPLETYRTTYASYFERHPFSMDPPA